MIDKEDFNFYSKFCHFVKFNEHSIEKNCTHFDGDNLCSLDSCPLVKERLIKKRGK